MNSQWNPKLLYQKNSIHRAGLFWKDINDVVASHTNVVQKDLLRGTAGVQCDEVNQALAMLMDEIGAQSHQGHDDDKVNTAANFTESICPVCHGIIDTQPTTPACHHPEEAMRDTRFKRGENNCPICLGWLFPPSSQTQITTFENGSSSEDKA